MFFIVIFSVYAIAAVYLMHRGWQALEYLPNIRPYVIAFFALISLMYLAVRFIRISDDSILSKIIGSIEAVWLVPMLYLVIFALAIDVLRIIQWAIPYHPACLATMSYTALKFWTMVVGIVIVAIICAHGHYKFMHPKVTEMDLSLPATEGGVDSMKMVMVSDIHLGSTTHPKRFEEYIDKINSFNPDVVCIAGDLMDFGMSESSIDKATKAMSTLKAKYGVYIVAGNHDYFAGIKTFQTAVSEAGITFLADSAVNVASTIQIMGRRDKNYKERKSLSELIAEYPTVLPVVLLDHQPADLSEAMNNNVALQLGAYP